ncbi:MAG TPA: hypothetical protein VFP53_01125 [Sphingomicrobium sp.]|nr:hypothetical protein [Sphingomicrobium sp.]
MPNSIERTAATRARWAAELVNAIESAQRLAWQLGTADRPSTQARELYTRLEAARVEAEAMRGVRDRVAESVESHWIDSLGWSRPVLDPTD